MPGVGEQPAGGRGDLPGVVGGLGERLRPGQRREVVAAQLERHRAAGERGLPQPLAHPRGHRVDLAAEHVEVGQVALERLLVRHRLGLPVRDDGAVVLGARQRVQPRPVRPAGQRHQVGQRLRREVGDRLHADLVQPLGGRRAHPAEPGHRQRVQHVELAAGWDDDQAVRACPGRSRSWPASSTSRSPPSRSRRRWPRRSAPSAPRPIAVTPSTDRSCPSPAARST